MCEQKFEVVDRTYFEDEGNVIFVGTHDECQGFIQDQGIGCEIRYQSRMAHQSKVIGEKNGN